MRYQGNAPIAISWTYPWCLKMCKMFPKALGIDNTYKTNRYNMYLSEFAVVTDQRSVANVVFGVVNTEREEGYRWLCDQVKKVLEEEETSMPKVAITDKKAALKNALALVFPDTQQQLWVWHINVNVRARIRSSFKNNTDAFDAANAVDDRPDPPHDE